MKKKRRELEEETGAVGMVRVKQKSIILDKSCNCTERLKSRHEAPKSQLKLS